MLKSITAFGLATVSAVPLFSAQATAPQLPLQLTAFAVSVGGPRTSGVATAVDLTIDRWSSPDEKARLVNVLNEQGAEKLLSVLQ